jgi:hypothetical protein
MSTFYLLPPRPLLADSFADFLGRFFPGLPWDAAGRERLADLLAQAVSPHADVYVVYREELPPEPCVSRALIDGFGAAGGDEVVEVRPGPRPGEVSVRRWRVADGEG